MNAYFSSFPRQKLPNSKKTKKWYQQCIDAVTESGFFSDEGVRASWEDKIINLNLYNGKLDTHDIVRTLNPEGLEDGTIPDSMQHYPIINPRIDVLVGEEAKRRFDFTAIVTNPEAISAKEESLNNEIKERVTELINSNYNERELDEKLRELDEDIRSYQDKREIRANRILTHLWNQQKLERVFNAGFKDALVLGEEYYESNIVSGEPYLKKLNPNKVFCVRSGFSNKIEDSDLIILDDYWSPGQIIDHFHDELKPSEIDKLETGNLGEGSDMDRPLADRMTMSVRMFDTNVEDDNNTLNSLINMGQFNGYHLNQPFDESGNIRVLRVYWRGQRKVQLITYFDELGNEQQDIFPESYIPKKDEGESSKTLWINEWYEGTKIGDDIYLNLRPKKIQHRSMNNPSYCHPGITGRTYSFNGTTTVSMMGRSRNYQYLYDAIHDRLNKALARNHGKVLVMDFATIPEGWDTEKWFHYLKKMGIAVTDSFKEGNKGAATGKLAGGMNNASKGYIDLETGQYIQQQIMLLEFVKREMSEITGVSDQRLGNISSTETVGGVERSVTQSSHITEPYFAEHDDVKLEALRILLETAKMAYRGKNKQVQYLLDDQSIQMLNMDGDEFADSDYGIVLTSSSKTQEAEAKLKQLAEVALNAGATTFSTVTDIYLSNSLAETKRKIEKAERDRMRRESEQTEQANKLAEAKIQQDAQDKQLDRDLETSKNIRDNNTKLQVALIGKSGDYSEEDATDFEKIRLDQQKIQNQAEQFDKKLNQDDRHFKEKLKVDKMKAKKPTKSS